MCQPLMDAVANHIASTPDINHILYKTFYPTVELLRTTDLRFVAYPLHGLNLFIELSLSNTFLRILSGTLSITLSNLSKFSTMIFLNPIYNYLQNCTTPFLELALEFFLKLSLSTLSRKYMPISPV